MNGAILRSGAKKSSNNYDFVVISYLTVYQN